MLPVDAPPPELATLLHELQVLAAAFEGSAAEVGYPSAREGDTVRLPRTAPERAGWLVGLRQLVDTAEALFTHVVADFDAAGDGQVLHAAPATSTWLRGVLGMAGATAAEHVRIARATRTDLAAALSALSSPPASTADGQEPGRLSFGHLRVIAKTCRTLPPSARADAAAHLTHLATQLGVDPLRAAARHLQHVIDPDGSARHAEEDYGRRWLTLAPLLDGMATINGVLDTETAARLDSALAPFLVPNGPDDLRTTPQRRADGLADLVITAVATGQLPTLSGATAALQIDVPLATLAGHSFEPARVTTSASWLTPATAERLACDASIRRLLLDPAGLPLDLGRSVRLFTAAQRRALTHRDQGCRFPACTRPATHTDAHHLIPWAKGGTSDLSNGLLFCRHHHRIVHEGGWYITPHSTTRGASGTLTFTGPAGQCLQSEIPARPGPGP